MSNPNENTFELQNDTDLLSELEPDWRGAPVGANVYRQRRPNHRHRAEQDR